MRRLAQLLGVGKSTVHRWLKGEPIPATYAVKFCEIIDEDTMLQVLKGEQLLERYGLVDEWGNVNKPLALTRGVLIRFCKLLIIDSDLKSPVYNISP